MTTAPGNKWKCAAVTLLPPGLLSHDHSRAQWKLQTLLHGHSVPTEMTVAKEKSSSSETYGKIDDSMMEGESALSALSIHLPAREWWVIKIY